MLKRLAFHKRYILSFCFVVQRNGRGKPLLFNIEDINQNEIGIEYKSILLSEMIETKRGTWTATINHWVEITTTKNMYNHNVEIFREI